MNLFELYDPRQNIFLNRSDDINIKIKKPVGLEGLGTRGDLRPDGLGWRGDLQGDLDGFAEGSSRESPSMMVDISSSSSSSEVQKYHKHLKKKFKREFSKNYNYMWLTENHI